MALSDIRVNISRQNVTLSCDDTSLRLQANNWQSVIPVRDIRFVANFVHGTYVALSKRHLVSPRKKHPGHTVCITGAAVPLELPGGVQCDDFTNPDRTFIGFTGRNALHVSDDGALAVAGHDWCEIVRLSNVQTVILQRTTGGMSMFDLAVLPVTNRKLEVDNVPHSKLASLKALLGNNFVDVGGDPVTPFWNGNVWIVPDVMSDSSSEEGSVYDPDAPSSSSSDESFGVQSETSDIDSDAE